MTDLPATRSPGTLSKVLRHPAVAHPRTAPAYVILMGVIALGTAFVAQYVFNLYPCILCVWERWAYGVALGAGVLALLFAGHARARRLLLWLAALGFVAVFVISVYHVGVENGWWTGSAECSGEGIKPGMSREDLKNAILGAPKIACTDVVWSLWGITLAGFNAIFAPVFAVITLVLTVRRS